MSTIRIVAELTTQQLLYVFHTQLRISLRAANPSPTSLYDESRCVVVLPTCVLLHIGTNDINHGQSAESWRRICTVCSFASRRASPLLNASYERCSSPLPYIALVTPSPERAIFVQDERQ